MEKFEKVKNLGRGSQGSVILVRRKADGSKFVIKRIFVDDQSPEDREEVMNEIRVLAQLAHPNVVGYHGSFIEDGVLNVVMEYADNGSLFQYIQRSKQPLEEQDIIHIFTQLLMALDHLHDKKILHRDLKTKNIFITKKNQVKLGDFGLSKMLGTTSFAQSAVGTPYYLSPELCEGKRYNHKSDVWAIGCVLYELTTFKHAFDATNLPALVMAIVQGSYAPVPDTYSAHLKGAVEMMLQKDPDARPGLKELLELPLVAETADRLREETQEALQAAMQVQRPYFEAGSVETALTRGAQHKPNAKSILSEVEEEQQFERLIERMRAGMSIQDRVQARVPFFKCFVGSELVDYLVHTLGLEGREEATAAAQRWMDSGVFYHVTRTELFRDSTALFRFKEDEVGSILNMKSRWSGPVRQAVEVEQDFRQKLAVMFQRYTSEGQRLVDYEGLAHGEEFKDFTASSAELQKFDLMAISFNVKIAFFINLYNALAIHGFVVTGPPTNLYQRLYYYNHTNYSIGGMVYSLNDIEHGVLRGNQKPHTSYRRVFHRDDPRLQSAVVVWDPRIQFALCRGTRSCPPLQVYDPSRLDAMLDAATRDFCGRHVELTPTLGEDGSAGKTQVVLPAVFEWYQEDFGSHEGDMLHWVAGFLSAAKAKAMRAAVDGDNFVIKYLPFDWSLNTKHRPSPHMPVNASGGVRQPVMPPQ